MAEIRRLNKSVYISGVTIIPYDTQTPVGRTMFTTSGSFTPAAGVHAVDVFMVAGRVS